MHSTYFLRPIKNQHSNVPHPSTTNLDIRMFKFVVLERITSIFFTERVLHISTYAKYAHGGVGLEQVQ